MKLEVPSKSRINPYPRSGIYNAALGRIVPLEMAAMALAASELNNQRPLDVLRAACELLTDEGNPFASVSKASTEGISHEEFQAMVDAAEARLKARR
jgi:hypothetical protein